MTEQIIIFFQIVFIDLVLAGDNAIIIGMVASQFDPKERKRIIFWGIGAAIVLRILFTLVTVYLLQIDGLKIIGGLGVKSHYVLFRWASLGSFTPQNGKILQPDNSLHENARTRIWIKLKSGTDRSRQIYRRDGRLAGR